MTESSNCPHTRVSRQDRARKKELLCLETESRSRAIIEGKKKRISLRLMEQWLADWSIAYVHGKQIAVK